MVLRETRNNAYAKVWRDEERVLWHFLYLTIRPIAPKGYGSIAREAKPNGLLY